MILGRSTDRRAVVALVALAVAGAGWLGERLAPPSLEDELRDAVDAVVIYQRVYGGELNGLRAGTLPRDEEGLRDGGWVPHERTIVPERPVRGTPDDWCLVLARANSDAGSDVLRTGDDSKLYDMAMYVHRTGQVSFVQEPDCSIFLTPR